MSVSVVAAFVFAVAAAAGTGVLVGRCIRIPRMDLIAWACVLAALAVALGAQAIGAHRGYDSVTFRTVQVGAQLIAPLWLAWGLTELAAKNVPARFAVKLVTVALTVVTAVVLVTDPLSDTPFTKSFPVASKHYQIIPRSLLSLVAAVTLVIVVIALASSLLRLRNHPQWRRPVIAVAAAGAGAVLVLGLRLTVSHNSVYLALCAVCVALTWFAGLWAARVNLAELHGEPYEPYDRGARRGRQARPGAGEADDDALDPGYPQLTEAAGHRRYADDDWYRPAGSYQGNGGLGPAEGYRHNGESGMNRLRQGDRDGYQPEEGYRPEEGYQPENGYRREGEREEGPNALSDAGRTGIWRPRTLGSPAAARAGTGGITGAPGAPAAGVGTAEAIAVSAAAAAAAAIADAATGPEPAVGVAADPAVTQRLYGLIAIYTLAEDCTAEFDALAERVVEEVRASEPDALVYAVHSVPNAEKQRIFYEVYRDRMAYEGHKRQPHIQQFEVDRSPYVLATNVIELGMQQAKLSSLPGLSQLFGSAPGD